LEDAQHLIDALKKDYTITIDWDATKYIGLTIEWDYVKGKVHVHMPRYLPKSPTTIQPSATKEEAELTIPTRCTPIWS
jgi:hypothetical protein